MTLKNLGFITLRKNDEDNYSPLLSLQERVNEAFESLFSNIHISPHLGYADKFPFINVKETSKAITIKAELPGIEENDLKIDVNKNKILISGEKKSEIDEEKSTYYLHELSYGKFSRSVVLPFDVDPNKTTASFTKGILTVIIEKPAVEIDKTHTIAITHEK